MTNYCLDNNNDKSELLSRKSHLCKNLKAGCPYYYCTNGICKRSYNTCKLCFFTLIYNNIHYYRSKKKNYIYIYICVYIFYLNFF